MWLISDSSFRLTWVPRNLTKVDTPTPSLKLYLQSWLCYWVHRYTEIEREWLQRVLVNRYHKPNRNTWVSNLHNGRSRRIVHRATETRYLRCKMRSGRRYWFVPCFTKVKATTFGKNFSYQFLIQLNNENAHFLINTKELQAKAWSVKLKSLLKSTHEKYMTNSVLYCRCW